jgi:hypothetical protein
MVVSKGSNTPMSRGHESLNNDSGSCSPSVAPEGKVYKDNSLNRRLNRVGLPHGAAVHSLVNLSQKQPAVSPKTYVDNDSKDCPCRPFLWGSQTDYKNHYRCSNSCELYSLACCNL